MGKKILRGVGIAICIVLFALCVFMIIMSAMFGSTEVVGVFGYNMFLCEDSSYEGIEGGSAVIVERCQPYDVEQGMLILYMQGDEASADTAAPVSGTAQADEEKQLVPMLGYAEPAVLTDGVYYINVTDSAEKTKQILGTDLVGRASWSSPILGKLISFSLSPWGICVMAVLPCLALIIYSIVKSAIENGPLPEVQPLRKNDEDEEKPQSSIAVKSDGNAEYGRKSGAKPVSTADSVLFTYGKPKSPAVMKPSAPAADIQPKHEEPAAKPVSGSVPTSVAARRYIDSATAAQKKNTDTLIRTEAPKPAPKPMVKPEPTPEPQQNDKLSAILSGATAEMPSMQKKKKSDAFFAQSEAPQIGRGLKKGSPRREVIDLEDALASAAPKTGKQVDSGRKSAAILASKSRSELIADDDDSRDRNRYDVDDILAGLNRKR